MKTDDEQLTVVVLDNGSSTVKAGFSGEDAPRVETPCMIGFARHPGVTGPMLGANSDVLAGAVAHDIRGLLNVNRSQSKGLITDWEAVQHLWHHVLFDQLKVACEEHPLMITVTPDTTREDAEKIVEILFECFNFPAVMLANTSVLTLFSTGRTSGVVVDSGASRTHVGPVWEGYAFPHFARRLDIGGDDVTQLLKDRFRAEGYPFSTPTDVDNLQRIKETLCYVSLNVDKELDYCKQSRSVERWFDLPDGQKIFLNDHRFTIPEVLFNPVRLLGSDAQGVPGLHELVHTAVQMCDPNIQAELYSAVVLGGGNTLFPKLDERVQREVSNLAPKGTTVRTVAFPDRKYATWLGGSIVGSLKTFPCMWVSKNEYDDYGASIVHRKR